MGIDRPTASNEADPFCSATERAIAALWSEVLQTAAPPGATDNFFELGGNSMAMVLLEYRIKEELRVDLPAGSLLGAPTLRELSALVDAEGQDPLPCG